MNAGIDYGHGLANIDHETGIRYGVISSHSLAPYALEDIPPVYGEPTCPFDGTSPVLDQDTAETLGYSFRNDKTRDYWCSECHGWFWSEECYPEEPAGYALHDAEYDIVDCLDSDFMVLRSPFYTYAPFCSPCVPGAGNLDDATDNDQEPGGVKTYALPGEWFEDGVAPYPLWRVDTDTPILQ